MIDVDFHQYRDEALDYAKAEKKRRDRIKALPLEVPAATILIEESDDWKMIRRKNLNVVVDPMVFRTAEVFLRGLHGFLEQRQAPEPKHPESMWNAIKSNIGSLCLFFDSLILEERLPMYDYYMTFPPDLETGKRTLVKLCNESEEVLFPVTVRDPAYAEMKREAVAVLEKLPDVPGATANDILDDLSAFEWEWRPDLWRYEKNEESDARRVLDAFRYGGILFSGYAQRTGSDHVLQPKRARLYLALSLGGHQANDEKVLLAELTKIANEAPEGVQRLGDLPAAPTFLPYLLTFNDKTPLELLNRALSLKKSAAVLEYRRWRQDVMESIDKGRVPNELQKEIARIAAAIRRELRVDNSSTKVSAKMTAKIALVGPLPVPEAGAEVGVEKELNLAEGLGWFLRNIPGHRYRKLLMRMVMAQREYWHIENQLRTIWRAA
jgi:hypothetical protein